MVTSNLPRELSERVSLCFTAINYQNVGDKKQEKRNTRKKHKRQEIKGTFVFSGERGGSEIYFFKYKRSIKQENFISGNV